MVELTVDETAVAAATTWSNGLGYKNDKNKSNFWIQQLGGRGRDL